MTKLLVLGLLDGGPMSGYDLQQKLGGADAERWGGVLPGSIYHALKKLEGEGCIALAGVEQTGHRQKASTGLRGGPEPSARDRRRPAGLLRPLSHHTLQRPLTGRQAASGGGAAGPGGAAAAAGGGVRRPGAGPRRQ
ncbi:MAG: PadR family transcriptional regulator [Flavonifractor plautii]